MIGRTDLLVRHQKLSCCIGTKTGQLAKQLQLTGECSNQQFKQLRLLLAYDDILRNYRLPVDETRAFVDYTATWTGGSGNFTLLVIIGMPGETPNFRSFSIVNQPNQDTALTNAAATINSSGYGFTASYDTTTKKFLLQAPAGFGKTPNKNWSLTFAVFAGLPPSINNPVTQFDYGVDAITEDDIYNCLDDTQMKQIFEQISKLCKICFEPLGFNYKEQTDTVNDRLLTTGETRIVTTGENRSTT